MDSKPEIPNAAPEGRPAAPAVRPADEPSYAPCVLLVREDARAMRSIQCIFDGRPSYMLRLLRACYRTREEALALVRAGDMVSIDFCLEFCELREADDGSSGHSCAVPYRTESVLEAAKGGEAIYVFDDEAGLWHAWNAVGWRVDEDPAAPALSDLVERLGSAPSYDPF